MAKENKEDDVKLAHASHAQYMILQVKFAVQV